MVHPRHAVQHPTNPLGGGITIVTRILREEFEDKVLAAR